MMRLFLAIFAALGIASAAVAQQGPLRLEITDGVIEPLTFAIPAFEAETPNAAEAAAELTRVVASDLVGSGLFREIAPTSFVAQRETFDEAVRYPDWRVINVQDRIIRRP